MKKIEETVNENYGTEVAKLGNRNQVKDHFCKICGKKFEKSTGLGGHMAKMHPSRKKDSRKPTTGANKSSRSKVIKKEDHPSTIETKES